MQEPLKKTIRTTRTQMLIQACKELPGLFNDLNQKMQLSIATHKKSDQILQQKLNKIPICGQTLIKTEESL